MRGSLKETVLAILLAISGVLVCASTIRLVALGYGSIRQRLQRAEASRTLDQALTPSPVRTPAGAIHTQITALQHNDSPVPNAGLATFYSFMEPTIRHNLGTFTEYQDAMIGSIYGDLFTPAEIRYSPIRIQDDQAQQFVYVSTSPVQRAMYIFTLALQETGPYAGCWLTRNVVRYPLQQPHSAAPD